MNFENNYAEKSKTSKEKFYTIAAAVAGFLTISGIVLEKNKTPFDSNLIELLDSNTIKLENGTSISLPNFKGFNDVKIYKKPEDQPKKVIVLLGQTHEMGEAVLEQSNEIERWTELSSMVSSQQSIYTALDKLVDTNVLSKVCIEGESTQKAINEEINGLANDASKATSTIISPYISHSQAVQETMNTEDYKYAVGGAELLAVEKQLTLCPAETLQANEAAFEALEQFSEETSTRPVTQRDIDLLRSSLLEAREDVAFEKIASQPEEVVGLVYGNSHNFVDALSRWNEKNPTNTFGLAVYSAKETNMFPAQDELLTRGFTQYEVETVSYAMKYKPWVQNELTVSQQADGLSWLMENGNKYDFSEEKIVALSEVLQFGK